MILRMERIIMGMNHFATRELYHRKEDKEDSLPIQKELILNILKDKGFRITRQRQIIIEIILGNKCSCCKEIYYESSKIDNTIGVATVYRLVNTLEQIGLINRNNYYDLLVSQCRGCMNEDGGSDGIDYHEIIECIMGALDAKDPYTAGHSQRVSEMALNVCQIIGYDKELTEKIHVAAHLHDIGKIGVPDSVLNKNESLNEEEWNKLKKHPQIGADILSKSRHLNELKGMVLHHHERYDGKGYPFGLKGDNIPLGARIIAICDSIDAMLSERSYRKAYSEAFCVSELSNNLGKMYDPQIGKIVLANWDKVTSV